MCRILFFRKNFLCLFLLLLLSVLYFPLSPACFISSRNLFQITICLPSFNLIFPTFEICKKNKRRGGKAKKEMSFPVKFFH